VRSATLTVRQKVGLHARPAAMFVQQAMKHKCRITIESSGRKADAKSILQVLALGVKCGQDVTIIAEGPEEDVALERLVTLMMDMEEKS